MLDMDERVGQVSGHNSFAIEAVSAVFRGILLESQTICCLLSKEDALVVASTASVAITAKVTSGTKKEEKTNAS